MTAIPLGIPGLKGELLPLPGPKLRLSDAQRYPRAELDGNISPFQGRETIPARRRACDASGAVTIKGDGLIVRGIEQAMIPDAHRPLLVVNINGRCRGSGGVVRGRLLIVVADGV